MEREIGEKKGYTLRFMKRDGYLYVFASGARDSVEISTDYWRKAVTECRKRGYRRLLVEDDFPNVLSVTETFKLVQAIVRLPVSGLRIAYLQQKAELKNLIMFAENVAVNRGMTAGAFHDLAGAEAWLLGK